MLIEKQILGVGSRVKHPAYGDGVVIRLHLKAYEESVTFTDAERSLMRILRTWSDVNEVVPMSDKWKDGIMILKPKDASYKSHEFPIDSFFHKIVMTRDRLRVMEQRVNASALTDEEKVNLQQYITRIYGSLTSFNILFKNKEDNFVGQKNE